MSNIYLIGLMGCGKSTIGALLAKELQREFWDLDNFIEQIAGKSILEIFSQKGEQEFRLLETKALKKLSEKQEVVIATGGGVIIDKNNRSIMEQTGIRVYLEVKLESLLKRLGSDQNRPLLANLSYEKKYQKLRHILAERKEGYCDNEIVIQAEENPLEITQKILCILKKQNSNNLDNHSM